MRTKPQTMGNSRKLEPQIVQNSWKLSAENSGMLRRSRRTSESPATPCLAHSELSVEPPEAHDHGGTVRATSTGLHYPLGFYGRKEHGIRHPIPRRSRHLVCMMDSECGHGKILRGIRPPEHCCSYPLSCSLATFGCPPWYSVVIGLSHGSGCFDKLRLIIQAFYNQQITTQTLYSQSLNRCNKNLSQHGTL